MRAVLERASQAGASCPISVVNWGEVLYVVARRAGPAAIPRAIEKLGGLPIHVVDADRDLTVRAAMLKASGRLDYADAFCAALALTLDAPLMTCDRDFEAMACDGEFEVEFVR